MIPIVSLANSLSFLVSIAIAVKLYFSMQSSKDPQFRYFFFCFLSLAVFFGIISFPGIVSENGRFLDITNAISIAFVMLGALLFTIIPIKMFEWDKTRIIYIVVGGIIVVAAPVIRFFGLGEMTPTVQRDF